MKMILTIPWLVMILFLHECSFSGTNQQTTILVSSASSLQGLLSDIEEQFEEKYPDIDVVFNFGSSGSLKQQILYGAPVDVYLSASKDAFVELIREKKMDKEHSTILLRNSLVLVTKDGITIRDTKDLTSSVIERVAIGTPESVPAGKYAKEALTSLQLWEDLHPKLVQAKNVRQVLTYVESGDADAGMVYKTDAVSASDIHITTEIPENLHTPILYPVGVTNFGKEKKEAMLLYEFLQSQEIQHFIEKHGFQKVTGGDLP